MLIQAALAAGFYTSLNGGDFGSAFLLYSFFVAILWAIVYAVARAKNRQCSTWLAATFLLGFLPLVILIFLRRNKFRAGETKICPHCQSEIPDEATVCRYCTRDVGLPATPVT